MSDAAAGRLETLDALRGVGTFLVVVYHLNFLPGGLFSNCYVGLDFFFVLSGFVIAMTYDQRMRGGYAFKRFMEARLIRLYPMYLVGLLLGATFVAVAIVAGKEYAPSTREALEGFAFGLFILPAPSAVGDFFPLNGPFWSLLFEMIAYVLYGLFAARLSRVALACVAGAAAVALFVFGAGVGNLELGWNWATAPGGLFRVLFSFAMGVLMFRALPAGP